MPKSRNKLAGQRLKIAREAYALTQEDLPDYLEGWKKNVNIFDTKTIGVWEREGVPNKKITLVAECFKIEPNYFTDPGIDNENFRQKSIGIYLGLDFLQAD